MQHSFIRIYKFLIVLVSLNLQIAGDFRSEHSCRDRITLLSDVTLKLFSLGGVDNNFHSKVSILWHSHEGDSHQSLPLSFQFSLDQYGRLIPASNYALTSYPLTYILCTARMIRNK